MSQPADLPPLTAEQQQQVVESMGLAHEVVVSRIVAHPMLWVFRDDLLGAAMLGLVLAVQNHGRTVLPFRTYALRRIQMAVTVEVCSTATAGQRWRWNVVCTLERVRTEAMQGLQGRERGLLRVSGWSSNDAAETVRSLGIPHKRLRQVMDQLACPFRRALDRVRARGGDD